MKKITLLILPVLFLTISSFNISEWITFTSETGRFSVMLPVQPTASSETKNEGPGSPYTTQLYISRHEKVFYLVGFVDYTPEFRFENKSELEANRDNFLPGVDATLLDSKFLKIDGYDGIHFTAKGNTTDYLWTCKLLIVGKRPYMLVIGSPDGKASADEEKFFSSFKLSK